MIVTKRQKHYATITILLTGSGLGVIAALWIYVDRRSKAKIRKPIANITSLNDDVKGFLACYDVDCIRGFIPKQDPLQRLPHPLLQPHETLASQLAELLPKGKQGKLREKAEALPLVENLDEIVISEPERRRVLLLYAALASAYVWGGGDDVEPRDRIPACIAIPLHQVATSLKTSPVLSHMSNCLYNWRRINEGIAADDDNEIEHPLRAQDLQVTMSFTGNEDERFFYLLTLEIEALGGPALTCLEKARRIVEYLARSDTGGRGKEGEDAVMRRRSKEHYEVQVAELLGEVQRRIHEMQKTMVSMPKFVAPDVFYRRIRPYLSAWLNNPTLPNGVIYEGVQGNKRQKYSGGSAAQSSIIAALDAYLGIDHSTGKGSSTSYPFLKSMRDYMPQGHRTFLNDLEEDLRCNYQYSICAYALSGSNNGEVRQKFNACIAALADFRTKHLGIVAIYILGQQKQRSEDEENHKEGKGGLENAAGGKGTGGMDLTDFLRPLRDHTV